MIRVLQVIGVMDRGGAETMIMNLYRAIDRTKIQFDFLVHEQREGDYDDEIRRLGGRFFRLPRYNIVNRLSYRKQCRELFESHPEWHIVHGHIGSCAPIYLNEAKRAGKYAIAHSHALNFYTGIMHVAFDAMCHPVRGVADYYMACSREAGVDRFGEDIVSGGSFSVLANGIDVELYRCSQQTHLQAKERLGYAGRPVICHVGRLVPVKNHKFLLEVFEDVLKTLPDAVLVLAGRGELEAELKHEVNQRGLAESVRFLGVVDDVPELLKASDAFLFPSVNEGLALAAVEAQASGLPTIVSTGVPEAAVVTDHCKRLPLSKGARFWAEACADDIAALQHDTRRDDIQAVRDHGFDIAKTSAWLARFYEEADAGKSVYREV